MPGALANHNEDGLAGGREGKPLTSDLAFPSRCPLTFVWPRFRRRRRPLRRRRPPRRAGSYGTRWNGPVPPWGTTAASGSCCGGAGRGGGRGAAGRGKGVLGPACTGAGGGVSGGVLGPP